MVSLRATDVEPVFWGATTPAVLEGEDIKAGLVGSALRHRLGVQGPGLAVLSVAGVGTRETKSTRV